MLAQERDDFDENADKKAKAVKKKSPTIEDNRSKKEHINVVFIGHVGKQIIHIHLTKQNSNGLFFSIGKHYNSGDNFYCRCWQIDNRRSNHVIDRHG